jgi:hypothetical protein
VYSFASNNDPMRRLALVAIPTLVLGVGLIELSSRVEDRHVAKSPRVLGLQVTPSPTGAPIVLSTAAPVTTVRPPFPSVSPGIVLVTPRPAVSAATPTPKVTPSPVPVRAGPQRPARIDCNSDSERRYCSNPMTLVVRDGRNQGLTSSTVAQDGIPTYTESVTPLRNDAETPSRHGEECGFAKVKLEIVNNTSKSFVFPNGDLTLVLTKDGQPAGEFRETPGKDNFVMEPGARMEATFLIPLGDGRWGFQGQTFYYERTA